jgi:C4-dicarboxylate-binding protein DctP
MRIQSSKVLEAQMRALGALPQVMALSEVYQGLQTGVVDGTENVISNFYTQKLFEVQKDVTLTNHGYIGYVVIVNKKFWDGLPPDVRTTLDGAMKEATQYGNDIAKKDNDDALAAVRKSGRTQVIELTADEKRAWKKALMKVHAEMESRVGKQLLADIYKETNFDPAKP